MIPFLVFCSLLIPVNLWAAITTHNHNEMSMRILHGVCTMVLLPLVRSKVDVPIIAAGGFVDGASMAAAFALGAEAVQMGTRMVSAAESPVHENWKSAIVSAR